MDIWPLTASTDVLNLSRDHVAPAARLGGIAGCVGTGEGLVRGADTNGSYTDRRANRIVFPVPLKIDVGDGIDDLPGDLHGIRNRAGVEQNDELIAAEAGCKILRPACCTDNLGDGLQQYARLVDEWVAALLLGFDYGLTAFHVR